MSAEGCYTLGLVLVILADDRLDCKVFERSNTLTYLSRAVTKKKKCFYIDTNYQCFEVFFPSSLMPKTNKLECSFLTVVGLV
jgi:hypothetical protein